ncbi:MAG TPA: hypothetical protein VNS81_07370 [Nocardioides sp.]|nr:hypothetical protein [Nocardioides sp.]
MELVWSAEYANVGEAFFWEKRIQGWSRAKREALIRGDYNALPMLAKKDFSRREADGSGHPLAEASSPGEDEPPSLVE